MLNADERQNVIKTTRINTFQLLIVGVAINLNDKSKREAAFLLRAVHI